MKSIIKLVCIITIVLTMSGCGESTNLSEQLPFSDVTRNLTSPAFGGVDFINGITSPKSESIVTIVGDKIEIAGNYVDAINGDAATGVLVLIDDKAYKAVYGGERADIAKALNNPKYLKSQFYASIPTEKISAGQHGVKIRVIASDRSGYYDSNWTAKLDIKK